MGYAHVLRLDIARLCWNDIRTSAGCAQLQTRRPHRLHTER